MRTLLVVCFLLSACSSTPMTESAQDMQVDPDAEQVDQAADAAHADSDSKDVPAAVTNVTASGEDGGYSFSVTIRSDETGCDRYADWWEVVRPDGELVYRRILAHSHVDEQPFTRSGGPVAVAADEEVYVRVHMNDTGYADAGARFTVDGGFLAMDLAGFAPELAESQPLPSGCAF